MTEPTFDIEPPGPEDETAVAALTLRDWFAGMALLGQLASNISQGFIAAGVFEENAYAMADRMLRQRER